MTDLDVTIEKAHSAAEETENQARQVEARICCIAGADRLLPRRGYGQPVSSDDIARNLTLRGLIARNDPQLASYLGVSTDYHRQQEQAKAARAASSQALTAETERLRQVNAASSRYREQQQLAGVDGFGRPRWQR